jgi:hypothetical protein
MSSPRGKAILMGGGGVAALALGAVLLPAGGEAKSAQDTAAQSRVVPTRPARHVPVSSGDSSRISRTVQTGVAGRGFAPYVDVGLYPPFDLPGTAKKTGVKTFNLAFIVSGGGCEPKWAGAQALNDNAVAKQIGALRAAGGDVRVSFGGQAGAELGQVCTSASRLAAAYKKVIGAFKLTKVDFDIEGAAIADTAANTRRDRAIATLQKQVRGLNVSFTLPVLPTGLTQDGVNLVKDAKKNGVDIGAVNVMAMDYGDSVAPNPKGHMGDFAIRAATSTERQVGGGYGRIAVTPMIGVNDTSTEVFTVADAKKVAAFARDNKLAWASMWSAGRDKPCAGGPKNTADPTCSSIGQTPLAFTTAFTTS